MDLNWRVVKSTAEQREQVRKAQRSKYSAVKTCIYCGEEFDYGYSSLKSCLACKILVNCSICGKEFELNLNRYSGTDRNRINSSIINKENLVLYCSKECKCIAQGRAYSQYCKDNPDKIKEQFKTRYDAKTGHYFRGNDDLTLKAQMMRAKCKEIEDRNPDKRKQHRLKCIEAANKYWRSNPEKTKENAIKNIAGVNNRFMAWCDKCQKQTLHNDYTCLVCNPVGVKPNFTIKNNVKFYKNKEVTQLVKDILSGKEDINDYPGFDIRYGNHVCYQGVDIQNGEFLPIQGNFNIVDNTKFYKGKEVDKLVEDLLSGKENINNYPGFQIKLGRVTYNNIDILTDEKVLFASNFQVKDNVKYYKNESVEEIIAKLESGEYDVKDFPGWNKRFGRWCYGVQDVLTDDKIFLTGANFTIRNNIEYTLDHSTGQYALKDEFFKRFDDKLKAQNPAIEIEKFTNLDFNIEPIITIDNSNWNREQTDRYLVDKGYNWIVYIKLFHGKPFIVGKTGTSKVSQSYVDFDFKVCNESNLDDPNYTGQGRRFIRELYPDVKFTDFDKILVKNFNNETEALEYERYIVKTYNLFQS